MRRSIAQVILALVVLAGCTSPGEPPTSEPVAFTACAHPWPCADGSEWPAGLEGPFPLLPPEAVRLESHDGTILAGHIWRPDLPEGVRAPVIIFASPYFGQSRDIAEGNPDADGSTSNEARMEGFYGDFPRRGFALLLISVRGTGESGGCLGWGGLDEQLDQVATVEWAAAQPWSNGRVGYWGISYMGATPWEAAIHAPEALKAIWAGGIITDWYLNGYSPQGLSGNGYAEFSMQRHIGLGLTPAWNIPSDRYLESFPHTAERVCPGTPAAFTRHIGTTYVDDRNAEWFAQRRYIDHFESVTAAVMVTHGLKDNAAHRLQEDIIWDALPNAPKWFLLGQWGHTIDFDEQLVTYPHGHDDWNLTFAFFDFWLKGIGAPDANAPGKMGALPRVGNVDHQSSNGTWRESAAWPPPDARPETLHLGEGVLATQPQTGAWSFAATSVSGGTRPAREFPILDEERGCGAEALRGTILVFTSEPMSAPATIAGNPYALLQVESDRPGGGFNVELISFTGDSPCDDPAAVRLVSDGGVDLRFHDGTLQGHDFATGTSVPVRVDLWSVSHDLAAGERLALVLQPPREETQPWNPTITLHEGSHLVLPVLEGTLGGGAPPLSPPPRPFSGVG